MKLIKIIKNLILAAIFIPLTTAAIYLLAATIGALIPSPHNLQVKQAIDDEKTIDLYLLSTLLHVDIAVPLNKEIRQQFAFLKNDGFPLTHPQLDYLIFGWGSRRFYTSTRTLLDIGPGPVYTAITGDSSVLHVIPSTDLSRLPDIRKITVTRKGFRTMINNIRASFAHSANSRPAVLKGVSHGLSDAFYRAKGNFNILQPCNVWTARMLRSAGVKTGIWTPTTFSLMLSLD